MEILKKREDNKMTLSLVGRLDTTTAPQLEAVVAADLNGVTDLVLDFEQVAYISSAGLRVLLSTQKKMNGCGSMKLTNVSDGVMEVFEITGFSDVLTIV